MSALQKMMGWVDDRFPLTATYKAHLSEYYAPKNFNFWYFFGSLALLVLVLQIVTGIFLTMNYKPDAELAFASVEYIMRDVRLGLADSLHALHRRIDVLRRRLSAHVPWPDVRLVSQAARTDLDLRRADLSGADGRSLPGLPAAVGPDVVLGCAGDRQPVRCRAVHR